MVGKIQPRSFLLCLARADVSRSTSPSLTERFEALADEVERDRRGVVAAARSPSGFLAIAVDNVANAIKQISIARGHDVTRIRSCVSVALAGSTPASLLMRWA